MAITVEGNTWTEDVNSTTDVTITIPGTPAENDLVLAILCKWTAISGGRGGAVAITTPTDYTLELDPDTAQTSQTWGLNETGVWSKKMTSSPDSTFTCERGTQPNSGAWFGCYTLSGQDLTTPVEDAQYATGTNSVPDCPQVTFTASNALVIAHGFAAGPVNGNPGATTQPSGYTEDFEDWHTLNGREPMLNISRLSVSSSPENPGAHADFETGTDQYWIATTVAIAEAAAGGGGLSSRPLLTLGAGA